jgi:hypothetical protein
MSGHRDDGAVHMLEAILASVLVISTLFMASSYALRHPESSGDLSILASDILNVMTYKDSSLEHPGLGFTLLSPGRWKDYSSTLGADIEKMLPKGVFYYVATPYGTLGPMPADGSRTASVPFIAYSRPDGGPGEMLDCKLVLWRA